MAKRHKGQIALVSSVAGFMGLPNAPAYCASKAAVKTLGEGMRPNLAAQGIKLSVICPGYVKTAMTDANNFPMPFLMPAERAAALIARRLAANQGRIVFPWPMLVLARIMQALPAEWLGRMMMRLPAKAAAPPSP
jgi:short-subunit dehydrogenase